jgi:cyclopropane-fatty-acyl-phospholipid synthase
MRIASFLNKLLVNESLRLLDHDGRSYNCGPVGIPATLTVRFHDRRVPWALLVNPNVALGECYIDGRVTIEQGNIRDLLRLLFRQIDSYQRIHNVDPTLTFQQRLLMPMRRLHQLNTRSAAKKNVQHHYDIGNNIYELILGPTMQYSCGYWPGDWVGVDEATTKLHLDGNDVGDLDAAQYAKLNYLIAKLQIQDGMRILDIGCGWGGLALEIARRFDCHVVGVTLSDQQLMYARAATDKATLKGKVQFEATDYRDIRDKFDRIVSVGMFEHVGIAFYQTYFQTIDRLLASKGLFLLHTMGRVGDPGYTDPWIRKYIFPGGYIPALSEIMPAVMSAYLRPVDVETLRYHYAFTLREWFRHLQLHRKEIIEQMGDQFFRTYEFFYAASEMSFIYGSHLNYQILASKPDFVAPLTRDYLYSSKPEPADQAKPARHLRPV